MMRKKRRRTTENMLAVVLALSILFTSIIISPIVVTAETYTPIYTAADFAAINNNLSGNYILMNDIDLSEYANWSSLASLSTPFEGNLNGNGHKIFNMNIAIEVKGVINTGLFAKISNGEVCNLSIENANVSMISNEKTFQRDPSCVGLLAAQADNVRITNCYAAGKIMVTATGNTVQTGYVTVCAGGLIGKSSSAKFYGCGNSTNITAHAFDWGSKSYAGGISGCTDSNSIFEGCSNEGSVVATGEITDSFAGGIVGWGDDVNIKRCVNNANIQGGASNSFPPRSASAGGISGYFSNGQIEMSYNTGLIESTYAPGTVYNGGIVGSGSEIYIKECYNKSTVDSYTSDYEGDTVFVGGIIGASNGIEIENVYVIGNISFSNKYNNGGRLGGIIGKADGETKITNAYIISEFEKENSGIAGTVIGISSGASLTNIYISSTQSAIVGSGSSVNKNVLRKTTNDLKTRETFEGFDFEKVWIINIGEYPSLRFNKYANFTNNNAVINGKGYAYLRYKLADEDDNILINTPIEYFIDGYDSQGIAMTDADGIVCIQTPEISESQEFTITFTSPHGIEIADNVKTANITVEPLSFKQSWKGQVGVDGEIGISAGVGIEAGIFDADASAASASLAGGISKGLALENSYDKGERKLKISSTIGSDVGEKVSAGLWASGNVMDIAKVKLSPLELSGNTSIVSDQAKSLIIENYDPANPEHISQIAMFLLDANSNNIIAQIVYRIMNVETYNEEEVTQTIKISGGADVGKVKVNIGGNTSTESEFTLFSVGPTSVQTLSSSRNLEDGGFTFSNALSTSIGYDLLQINSLGVDHKIDSDTSIEAGISTEKGFGFWGNFVNNNIKFESEVNSGQFEEFTITSLDEENIDSTFFSIGEKVSAVEKNVIYKGSQSKSLLESDSSLTSLGLGEFGTISVMDLANILNNIAEANVQGQYERDKKYTQKYDASLGLGIKAIAELGLGFNLSGIYSDQFTYESGSVTNNTEQIQSVSTADAEFEASKKTLQQIVAEPIQYIGDVIAGNASYITGKAAEGVTNAGAKIKGTADYVIDIIYMAVPQVQTFSVLAVAEETDTFDTSSVATTVGNPYVINVKDNDGNTVSDFSATPLQLTLEYTAEELSAAGINNSIEDLNNLKIYWYNEETGVFVYVGGELDYENSSVTADITKSGQYILAFDNCAPSVTNFTTTNNTATPTFKATVADMSGISEFSFEIDGKEFVNSENINKFYSTDTAAFEYQITEELDDGEHTATITASDSAGNSMVNPMTITFSVDTVAPVVDSLDISDKIIDGKINVSVAVRDDNINSVKAYVENEKGIYTYNLQETDGIWSAEIDIPKDNSVNVWITAYDSAGNSTNSDKKLINIRSTTLEILGKYQNEFTATMERNSNAISINAIGNIPEARLFVAEYGSNNKLVKVQVINGVKTGNSTSFIADIPQLDNHKIMFWDKDLTPLINAITE